MNGNILSRVRAWVATAGLGDGARLPPERELSTLLGVTRAELRKAFLVMEADGTLERKVGRGTFLARGSKSRKTGSARETITDLAERTGPHEAMMARVTLEPELARMAALHATPRQLQELRQLSKSMRASTTWNTYEQLDSEFHDIIARASGNSLLHELHKIVNGVRLVVVWRRLDTSKTGPEPDYHSFDEHDAIVNALDQRLANEASKAMLAHLRSTIAAMNADVEQ